MLDEEEYDTRKDSGETVTNEPTETYRRRYISTS